MNRLKISLTFLVSVLIFPVTVLAQAQEAPKDNSASYFKFGVMYSGGEILSFDYHITGITLDMEMYSKKDHLYISGWSVGYVKTDRSHMEFGQMLNGKVFNVRNLGFVNLKTAFGVEWGAPTLSFDKTRFNSREPLSYEHLFLNRNSNLPGVGTSSDGILYPFFEVSAMKRGYVIFEVGTRLNIVRFGFDRYDVSANDVLTVRLSNHTRIVPYVFVNIGVRLKP